MCTVRSKDGLADEKGSEAILSSSEVERTTMVHDARHAFVESWERQQFVILVVPSRQHLRLNLKNARIMSISKSNAPGIL